MNLHPNRRLFVTAALLAAGAGLAAPARAQDAGSRNILWSVDWSSDGKSFAVGGAWTGIFDAQTKRMQTTPALRKFSSLASVRWHPNRNLLALSGGENGSTGIYDPMAGSIVTLQTKEGTRGISWNRTGDILATAGNRGELQIWSADGRLLHTTRPENAKSLTGVAWHPGEDKIVTVGEFITLHDGQGTILKQVRHRPEAKNPVLLLCVEWHPSGEFFVIGDYGNEETGDAPLIQSWSAGGKLLKVFDIKARAPVRNISWNADGSLLASASDALRVSSRDGQLKHTGESADLLWGVRWNRKGDQILTSSHRGTVALWTAEAKLAERVVEAPAGSGKPN